MSNDQFPMTNEGYLAAMQYLRQTNRENAIEGEKSTDGFTVVALANHFYEKDHSEDNTE